MSKRVAASDTAIIARGLLILLTVIIIGVGVAEYQLATLTERLEQPRFFILGVIKNMCIQLMFLGMD